MRSFKFLARIPNHLLAMFLGVTVLPLLSIGNSLLFTFMSLGLGFSALIIIPPALFNVIHKNGASKIASFFLTVLLGIPLALAIIISILTGTGIYLAAKLAVSIVQNAWIGLKNGLHNGMEGFRLAYQNYTFPFNLQSDVLQSDVRTIFNDSDDHIHPMGSDGFEQIVEELQDVIVTRSGLEVPDEETAPKATFNLLTNEELSAATDLFEQFTGEKAQETINLLRSLNLRLEQYKDLSARLDKVKNAIENNTLSALDDELMSMEIEIPILFVKQYQDKDKRGNDKWFNVPANSYITDKESLLTWFERSPSHPINRDNTKFPPPYNGKPTQYIYYKLNANYCYSQELGDGADEIRDILIKLQGKHIKENLQSENISFFANSSAIIAHNNSENDESKNAFNL